MKQYVEKKNREVKCITLTNNINNEQHVRVLSLEAGRITQHRKYKYVCSLTILFRHDHSKSQLFILIKIVLRGRKVARCTLAPIFFL